VTHKTTPACWQRDAAWFLTALILAACTSNAPVVNWPNSPPQGGNIADVVPKVEPKSRYGNPPFYIVAGKRYNVLPSSAGFIERGIASWYGPDFHGKRASSGETYDMYAMTAAHPSLPLPTYVQVTNLKNGRKAIVKVNDRGPFHDGRVIDLSYTAAWKLGILQRGTGLVEVRALDPNHPQTLPSAPAKKPVQVAVPGLFVQVGAFSNVRNAQRMRAQLLLSQLGKIHIQPGADARSPLYRVRIGPLSSVGAADLTAHRLEAMGLKDFRVVIE
jgi:rare lipoprotein A